MPDFDPKEWQRQRAADPRTNGELIAFARAHADDEYDENVDDVVSNALFVIAARATPVELELALRLSAAAEASDREIGAFLLGRIGRIYEPAFPEETISRLLELSRDPDDEVVVTACYSLGYRCDPSATERLAELAVHRNDEVREAVAFALHMLGPAEARLGS